MEAEERRQEDEKGEGAVVFYTMLDNIITSRFPPPSIPYQEAGAVFFTLGGSSPTLFSLVRNLFIFQAFLIMYELPI